MTGTILVQQYWVNAVGPVCGRHFLNTILPRSHQMKRFKLQLNAMVWHLLNLSRACVTQLHCQWLNDFNSCTALIPFWVAETKARLDGYTYCGPDRMTLTHFVTSSKHYIRNSIPFVSMCQENVSFQEETELHTTIRKMWQDSNYDYRQTSLPDSRRYNGLLGVHALAWAKRDGLWTGRVRISQLPLL